jgi:hypothetical protein
MDTPRHLLVVALLGAATHGIALAAAPPSGETAFDPAHFVASYFEYGPVVTEHWHIATFTPHGPIAGTFLPGYVPASDIAFDPHTGIYYGTARGPAFSYDPRTAVRTSLPASDPSHSALDGVTFDTTRNRVVFGTRVRGDGALLAYSPDDGSWTRLPGLAGVPVFDLAYSAADDTIYGLVANAWGDVNTAIIQRYTPDGLPAGSIRLAPSLPENLSEYSQLRVSGDHLVLITQPVGDLLDPRLPAVQRSYLIDPDTGAVTALGPIGVVPEPAAAALLFGGLAGTLFKPKRKAGAPVTG